ncbi:uncharacterized protein KQ657_005078 [Scheffersomyces spartinae]|uniref:WD40 repeat-like protein n=1 Tax=Scheffersomyces spartinae TaxID=45513 RepID=A0A9P7V9V1_9ASCO|nr:uncharacterized protein KQ657_005078 [Scheffersomyces spartinae]KAG7193880.1 hypothetical protein KQ657_005078 [Scheffersomyces spartinae]
MSLTSTELNYLIWRYLQESGHELAAFALDKASKCLNYEQTLAVTKVKPGCLVDLVQRGILYTMTESKIPGNEVTLEMLSLLGALEQHQHQQYQDDIENEQSENERFLLVIEAKNGSRNAEEDVDVEMNEEPSINNDNNNNNKQELPSPPEEPPVPTTIETPFTTKHIKPLVSFSSSICSDWHPGSEAFAYGQESSLAVISAFKDGEIAETVKLNHSSALSGNNEINIVSWSPNGNVLVTCGGFGDLRAWSPDGKLRNLAINTIDEPTTTTTSNAAATAAATGGGATASTSPADGPKNGDTGTNNNINTNANNGSVNNKALKLISSLIWNDNGQYLLTIDVNGEVCLRDGTNLNVIHHLTCAVSNGVSIDACWLDDFKFSVSTSKNTIRIFSITNTQLSIFGLPQIEVSPIGLLSGHENSITLIKFNPISKLLASCSDYDYIIKVWSSNSSTDPTVLNQRGGAHSQDADLILHSSPVVELKWLSSRHLLSVSMDGILNVWDVNTASSLISSKLFTTNENFHYDEEDHEDGDIPKEILVFNCAVTKDGKWLAIGDSLGRVTIWDISFDHYFTSTTADTKTTRNTIHCVGIYELQLPEMADTASAIGICDLKWDFTSTKLSVSYMGTTSLIFEFNP